MDSLLGNYYTAVSVIIVYHLFSLQQWVERALTVEETEEELRRTTPIGHIARERLKQRCRRLERAFPWIQIFVLFLAVSALNGLAIGVSLDLAARSPEEASTVSATDLVTMAQTDNSLQELSAEDRRSTAHKITPTGKMVDHGEDVSKLIYTGGPAAILWLTFIFATLIAWFQGRGVLRTIHRQL